MFPPFPPPLVPRSVCRLTRWRGAAQATHLIVSHMAKEPFTLFRWPVALLVACLANNHLHYFEPALFAWVALAITLVGYLHYVVSTIDEICSFLGAPHA